MSLPENRLDTGTQRNMIMAMAASIAMDKAEYATMVAKQYWAKDQQERAQHWEGIAFEARQAAGILHKYAGSWS